MSTPAASPTRPDSPVVERDDRFPSGIPFIVGNEGAERFSFYGMRQILYIYLTSLFIGFAAESTVAPDALTEAKIHATQITHLFNAGVYLFPMIGAILADRLLGKYRVIFWVSLVYCAGQAAMAFGGSAGSAGNLSLAQTAVFAGLILISLGSGGIKPCVSANVGDQFTAKNAHLVTRIFQIFYFIINFGSFFAALLTPWLFKHCGPKWAFGVPGILMAVATAVFWLGRRKFVRAPARPGGKLGLLDFLASSFLATPLLVLVAVGATVAEEVVRAAMSSQAGAVGAALVHIAHGYWPHALGAAGGFALGVVLFMARQQIQQDTGFFAVLLYCWRQRGTRAPGAGFWAPARVRFGDEAADGPPAVLRIIVVFSMVSVFWALFDQHSSTWVEQAKSMNLTLTVPVIFWYGWLVPAVVFGALFGALWLFLWVANHTMPRWLKLGFPCLLGAWGLVALVLQSGVGLPALGGFVAACGLSDLGHQITRGGISTITLHRRHRHHLRGAAERDHRLRVALPEFGNAAILRGGKEIFHTNTALAALIAEALACAGLPERRGPADRPTTDRAALDTLLKLDALVHCIIPRGGESLIRFVAENSTIPVIKHFKGVCFVYVDRDADPTWPSRSWSTPRCSGPACATPPNSCSYTPDAAEALLPRLARALLARKVELRCDPASAAILHSTAWPTAPPRRRTLPPSSST